MSVVSNFGMNETCLVYKTTRTLAPAKTLDSDVATAQGAS